MRDGLDLAPGMIAVGRLAGVAWPKNQEVAPIAVANSFAAVVNFLCTMSILDTEEDGNEIGKLRREYEVAASSSTFRPSRVARPIRDIMQLMEEFWRPVADLEARDALGAYDESLYATPSPYTLALVERFTRIDKTLTLRDAKSIMSEVGRLIGPAWPGAPRTATRPAWATAQLDEVNRSLRVLLWMVGWSAPTKYNANIGQFEEMTPEQLGVSLSTPALGALMSSSWCFFARFPLVTDFPSDRSERGALQHQVAKDRTDITQRALRAVEQVQIPLFEAKERALREVNERAQELEVQERSSAPAPKPEPQRYGVSPRGAELWVADALRWLGVRDAMVTRQSADGGVDIISKQYAVSVKHYVGKVPVEEVREIYGVALAMNRTPVLWTSGTLTAAAMEFAEGAPVAVIHYDVETAELTALNDAARELLSGRLGHSGLRL